MSCSDTVDAGGIVSLQLGPIPRELRPRDSREKVGVWLLPAPKWLELGLEYAVLPQMVQDAVLLRTKYPSQSIPHIRSSRCKQLANVFLETRMLFRRSLSLGDLSEFSLMFTVATLYHAHGSHSSSNSVS